ncbi:response regulator transcription factor [Paraburkholderia caribensis]|uniref:response regulator transcription factor n=1 Tax=Paraburkholderia caribensis TaxID=75105 RepID=UPI000722AF20|nr:response regulator transcription factor [Paraburkholderia caribensis]ALP68512.1 two-component system response regulator [Paraburkholderia caribensis]AUT57867.1 DNA-binding response regulator [Paraburkholderia caribensis]
MSHPRILTVEDDPISAGEIVDSLGGCGLSVDWVADGQEGVVRAMSGDYDAITLDRMLPGIDGLTILKMIRAAGVETPVMMLSSLGGVDERVRGLRAGGDDYLTKPFSSDELIVRIEVMLRRGKQAGRVEDGWLTVGALEIHFESRRVKLDGRFLELQPTEYKILEYMMRNAGITVTRTILFEEIWGYHFNPGTNLIAVHVARLRKKIEREGEPPLIRTVRGSGYVLG